LHGNDASKEKDSFRTLFNWWSGGIVEICFTRVPWVFGGFVVASILYHIRNDPTTFVTVQWLSENWELP